MWFDPPVLSITPSLPIVDLNICVVEPNCALCGDATQVKGKSTVTSVRRKMRTGLKGL